MAWNEIHWRSAILEKETVCQVLLPLTGKPPFPTLYLLHGLGGDSTYWLRKTRLEWLVRKLPLVVVMPDGYRGFFTDNEEGPAYGRHIAEELVAFIETNFRVRTDSASRAIGGCSMGGYGALQLALNYPDVFCAVHSHGGGFELDAKFGADRSNLPDTLKDQPETVFTEMRNIFGPIVAGSARDLRELAKAAKANGKLPEIWIDCGTEDPFLSANRAFHLALEDLGIRHVYRELSGGHDWGYYDARLPDALHFDAMHLGLGESNRTDVRPSARTASN